MRGIARGGKEYRIERMSDGHYILFIDGEFYSSADTYREAVEDLEEYETTGL